MSQPMTSAARSASGARLVGVGIVTSICALGEGGGYYDSGYVQPVDFFGDGTRIPLIAVSPYATNGYVSHNYADHVSILKFVERNWSLEPITKRSRDNLPNPVADLQTPWVPRNSPALDDMFDLFDFSGARAAEWGSDNDDG